MATQSQDNHLRIVHRNIAPEIEEFSILAAKYKLENYLNNPLELRLAATYNLGEFL